MPEPRDVNKLEHRGTSRTDGTAGTGGTTGADRTARAHRAPRCNRSSRSDRSDGAAGTGGANILTFKHTRTVANTCGPFDNFSVLDDPSINGNGNAAIFVTAIVGINAGRTNTNPNSNLNVTYTGALTFGSCPADRWIVAGGDISVGAEFNVMVVGP